MTDKIESARAELESILRPRPRACRRRREARYLRDWRGEVEAKAIAIARPATPIKSPPSCAFARAPGLQSSRKAATQECARGRRRIRCAPMRRRRARTHARHRAIDSQERAATVEAGVVLETLQEAARARGLLFPLDLGGARELPNWRNVGDQRGRREHHSPRLRARFVLGNRGGDGRRRNRRFALDAAQRQHRLRFEKSSYRQRRNARDYHRRDFAFARRGRGRASLVASPKKTQRRRCGCFRICRRETRRSRRSN